MLRRILMIGIIAAIGGVIAATRTNVPVTGESLQASPGATDASWDATGIKTGPSDMHTKVDPPAADTVSAPTAQAAADFDSAEVYLQDARKKLAEPR